MLELWHLHRRAMVIVGGVVAGAVVLVILVLVLRSSAPNAAHEAAPSNAQSTSPASAGSTAEPTAPATDVRSWNAIPPVVPAVSTGLPAIGAPASRDPDTFARSFVTELFTRNYTTQTRQELIAWAQYEDAPLESPNYPRADWSKVLVDSLTDVTWDSATDTPIPAVGPWLALRSERAHQTVSEVKVSLDSQWEAQVAGGYQPPDPLATVRDVSLTITQHTSTNAKPTVYEVSLAVQLGTSPRGGYGVAATNNYVSREVG